MIGKKTILIFFIIASVLLLILWKFEKHKKINVLPCRKYRVEKKHRYYARDEEVLFLRSNIYRIPSIEHFIYCEDKHILTVKEYIVPGWREPLQDISISNTAGASLNIYHGAPEEGRICGVYIEPPYVVYNTLKFSLIHFDYMCSRWERYNWESGWRERLIFR